MDKSHWKYRDSTDFEHISFHDAEIKVNKRIGNSRFLKLTDVSILDSHPLNPHAQHMDINHSNLVFDGVKEEQFILHTFRGISYNKKTGPISRGPVSVDFAFMFRILDYEIETNPKENNLKEYRFSG